MIEALIKNFTMILSTRRKVPIKKYWQENPILESWFSGRPVNFGDDKNPDIRIITTQEFIKQFKHALSAKVFEVLNTMLDGDIHLAHPLNDSNNEAISLLRRALNIPDRIFNIFKIKYITNLTNIFVIAQMLDELKENQSQGRTYDLEIKLLENQLNKLTVNKIHLESKSLFPTYRKRKNIETNSPLLNKTEQLNTILKNIPEALNGQYHFRVSIEIGQLLKNIHSEDEMGIFAITKFKKSDHYTVKIKNPEKYHAFYNRWRTILSQQELPVNHTSDPHFKNQAQPLLTELEVSSFKEKEALNNFIETNLSEVENSERILLNNHFKAPLPSVLDEPIANDFSEILQTDGLEKNFSDDSFCPFSEIETPKMAYSPHTFFNSNNSDSLHSEEIPSCKNPLSKKTKI